MIKVLEKNIADKIAAGEVIERPSSIVKELVENSIDSGADSIVVEIKNGGKSYIRVTDNGCGIEASEAETAFLRHATSKIERESDLNSIHTLGFRGEALASIAAVTHTDLVSKTPNSKMGINLLIHGGEVLSNKPTGCPDGTTIVITDLFYNTPARRKFLKSDAAESSQIIDFVSQIALAYTNIKFRFINNGNILFSTTGRGDMLGTILAVYKLSEYNSLVPVNYQEERKKIYGYISNPSLSRTSRKNQIFFVNGRIINSKVIEKGVAEGYKERLFDGRFPVTFLFIETDPAELDVNIHPNKKAVRFDDESSIVDLISQGIIEALGAKEAVIEASHIFKSEIPRKQNEKDVVQEKVNIKEILSTKRQASEVSDNTDILVENSRQYTGISDEKRAASLKPEISISSPHTTPFDFDVLTITGSIFGTYITAVDEKNFYLIDQHAAHERIMYENLVEEYMSEKKLHQPILTPIIAEVSLAVKEREYDWLDSLIEMGFTVEEFGQNSYVIKEIPTFMTLSEAETFVKTFIDAVENGNNLINKVVIDKLITKSCKTAVKANDHLSEEEAGSLMRQLKQCRNPFSCPHGRPTFIKMSRYEIEKMFKRV